MQLFDKRRMWRQHDLKSSYDVVIVGAGAHGLAAAYYLGKIHKVRKIALLDKNYLGPGPAGETQPSCVRIIELLKAYLFTTLHSNSTSSFHSIWNGTFCSVSAGT